MTVYRSCPVCGTPCPWPDEYCSRICWADDNPRADEYPEFDVDWNDDSR